MIGTLARNVLFDYLQTVIVILIGFYKFCCWQIMAYESLALDSRLSNV